MFVLILGKHNPKIDQPYVIPDDDEDTIPSRDDKMEPINVPLEIPADSIPQGHIEGQDQPAEHVQDLPRRSARIPVPTTRNRQDNAPETPVERAVRESRESAERICEAKAERRRAIEELHRPDDQNRQLPPAIEDKNIDLEHVLTILNTTEDDWSIDAEDVDPEVPKTWRQAQDSPDAERWKLAYKDELKFLKDMGVYRLIPRHEVPTGHRIHRGRPVFALKRNEKGDIVRFKVRHVLQGFNQVYGQEYTKTTSPTARAESWRILLHLAATQGWDAMQIDVKTAFLYGVLPEEETTYMEQPQGFEEPGKEDHVCKLERGLYGMKQAGQIWNCTLNENMVGKWGFTRLACESCVYYRKSDHGIVIAAVHVDDFLSIASSKRANEHFKSQLKQVWTISDLGTP